MQNNEKATILTLVKMEADVDPMSALPLVAWDGGRLNEVLKLIDPLPTGVGI